MTAEVPFRTAPEDPAALAGESPRRSGPIRRLRDAIRAIAATSRRPGPQGDPWQAAGEESGEDGGGFVRLRGGWSAQTGAWTCTEDIPLEHLWLERRFPDGGEAHRFAEQAVRLWNGDGVRVTVFEGGIPWDYGEMVPSDTRADLPPQEIAGFLARLERWTDDGDPGAE